MTYVWCKYQHGELCVSAEISVSNCKTVLDVMDSIKTCSDLGCLENEKLVLFAADDVTQIPAEFPILKLLEIYEKHEKKPLIVRKDTSIKVLPGEGPLEIGKHHMIPLPALEWGASLLEAIRSYHPILLHGHWQSGKTTSLKYIEYLFKADMNVVLIDLATAKVFLEIVLSTGSSIFRFLAHEISREDIETLPRLDSLSDFCDWLLRENSGDKKILLMIDEYDELIKMRTHLPKEATKALEDTNSLISAIARDKGTYFHAFILAGSFAVVPAAQNQEYIDIDSNYSLDHHHHHHRISENSRENSLNQAVTIEIAPFPDSLAKKFASDTSKYHSRCIPEVIFDDIYEIIQGHPGIHVWFVHQVMRDSVKKTLSLSEWFDLRVITYRERLVKSQGMSKMIQRLKACTGEVKEELLRLIRDTQVECSDSRIVGYLRAVGLVKCTPNSEILKFIAPVMVDILLKEIYLNSVVLPTLLGSWKFEGVWNIWKIAFT
jgi:hypothetical protein